MRAEPPSSSQGCPPKHYWSLKIKKKKTVSPRPFCYHVVCRQKDQTFQGNQTSSLEEYFEGVRG